VDIFKHTAKKIRKLNEQIKFYRKCMACSCKALYPCPFWKKIPFIVFFHILEENYRKERKNKIYIFLFGEFSSWNAKKKKKKKKTKKKGRKIFIFEKGGVGGRPLRLQAPVISTIYVFYRYALLDIKGWQVRKMVF